MKRIGRIVVILTVLGLLSLVSFILANASDAPVVERIEDRIGVFELDTGHVCVVTYRGEWYVPYVKCYCPCEVECAISSIVIEDTPEPPTPTDKPKCNSGRGNDSEGDPDCDPGNSGGHNKGGD